MSPSIVLHRVLKSYNTEDTQCVDFVSDHEARLGAATDGVIRDTDRTTTTSHRRRVCAMVQCRLVIMVTFVMLCALFAIPFPDHSRLTHDRRTHMRFHSGSLIACAATISLLSGCATTGALRRATDQQNAALAAQATAQQTALATERAERAASDSALRQEVGAVRGDVAALRTELQALKTDFGAKIASLEDGLHFAMPVNFDFNASTIRDADTPVLARFAHIVQQYYPQSKVTIEGFADPAGSARYNLALSGKRAKTVRDYLVTQGLVSDQLNAVGYGKTRLVTPKAWGDQPGAEMNRRVVFVIESKGQQAVALAAPDGQ
jgi:peptidoglycan-associated lipoprotein